MNHYTDNYNGCESEDILREINQIKKENPSDPRLDDMYSELEEARKSEYNEFIK